RDSSNLSIGVAMPSVYSTSFSSRPRKRAALVRSAMEGASQSPRGRVTANPEVILGSAGKVSLLVFLRPGAKGTSSYREPRFQGVSGAFRVIRALNPLS